MLLQDDFRTKSKLSDINCFEKSIEIISTKIHTSTDLKTNSFVRVPKWQFQIFLFPPLSPR